MSRVVGTAICAALCGLLVALARHCPAGIFRLYTRLSRHMMALIGRATAWIPFSLTEALIVLAILVFVYTLIRVLRKKASFLQWLLGICQTAAVLVLLYVAVWGLNYFSPVTLAEEVGLSVREYSTEELRSAAAYYLTMANALSEEVPRLSDGTLDAGDFEELAVLSGEGYAVLAEEYDCFGESTNLPKAVMCSELMSRCGLTGIFCCLTGEANLNTQTTAASLPFTMAHERAHGQAICPEDECNFAAYLACEASDSAVMRYSGYYSAFVYCYNALYRVSKSGASELWKGMSDGLRADILAGNAHYAAYEGKTREVAEKVNDTYLKTFQQTSGVQSYGEVADLLIADYLVSAAG